MSIEIERQLDYNVNLQYVLEQFKNSTSLVGIISAFNDEMSAVEECYDEIRTLIYLAVAEGVQLDTIGLIFDELRKGQNDTEYRAAITAKALETSSGTPEDIIEQVKVITGATYAYYTRSSNGLASYYLETDGAITTDQLIALSPAGVLPYVGQTLYTTSIDGLSAVEPIVLTTTAGTPSTTEILTATYVA